MSDNVIYLNEGNENKATSTPLQRFYIMSEEKQDIIHSTVDVDSLFQLFDSNDVELAEDTINNLDQIVSNALDDYYDNSKADICLHQLLTVMALFCSYSLAFKEFKLIHPEKRSFSYFVLVSKDENGQAILTEKLLALDTMISGDLLNDVFENMLENKQSPQSEVDVAL